MLNKRLTRQQVFYILAAVLLGFIAYTMMGKRQMVATYTKKPVRRIKSRYAMPSENGEKKPAAPAPQKTEDKPAGITGMDIDSIDMMYAPSNLEGTNIDLQTSCAMNNGVGLASSLLPREAASQENFGEFAPDDILKGQSFLNPRAQIGYPETVGGSLRNANQQIRAEPPNPKKAYVWQNSTIPPDSMQRPLST